MRKKWKGYFIVLLILILVLTFFYIRVYMAEKLSNSAKEPSKKEIPYGVGINIHFTGAPLDINLIKDAGFNIVRKDIFWESIEKRQGVYDFENSGYDKLINNLIESGIRPYLILNYSNKLYEEQVSVITPEGREAFGRFVNEVTLRYT